MPTRSTGSPSDPWRRAILEYIADHPDRPLKSRALARELRIPHLDYTRFRSTLREMLAEGVLLLGPGRTYILPTQTNAIVGTVRIDRRGYARVVRPNLPDVLVRKGFTAGALDGDTVTGRLLRRRGARGLRVAEVTRVIVRAETRWVGVLEQHGRRLSAMDSLIAATAVHGQLALVTRNVQDFAGTGLTFLNPWDDPSVSR